MKTSKFFSQSILDWYDIHGRKDLPWRKNINAYRVWISEIMLQQTQVTTVIPYFHRFIKKFPTIKKLATATEDEVFSLWAGLGYYSRARNLHRTAKIINKEFQGKFPQTVEALEKLPGIGRSTAGAISAIAFDQANPILDGNVKRVLTRVHAITEWPGKTAVADKLWKIATQYTPQKRASDYTQAIMDLGATICTRSKPACHICPINKICLAYQQDNPTAFPVRNPKQKIMPIKKTIMLLLRNHAQEILIEKRSAIGIWSGLWSLPETEDIKQWQQNQHYKIKNIKMLPSFRHTFTHFHLDITPVLIDIENSLPRIMESQQQLWYAPNKKFTGGFATPVKKLLHQIYQNNA